jgi:excisionase family DNA binding protein
LLSELAGDPEALRELAVALSVHQAPAPVDVDGWLTPAAAAKYLGVSRKRIYDLTSARALVPDGRDGRTPLFKRAVLDDYARSSARR